jgi:hypothetical protein
MVKHISVYGGSVCAERAYILHKIHSMQSILIQALKKHNISFPFFEKVQPSPPPRHPL